LSVAAPNKDAAGLFYFFSYPAAFYAAFISDSTAVVTAFYFDY